jgi:hypothetical protein
VKFLGIKVPCTLGDLILSVLDYIVTISFGYVLNYGFCNLYCGCFKLFCDMCVCVSVSFVICGCFGNMFTCIYCILCIVPFMYILFICFVCTSKRATAAE